MEEKKISLSMDEVSVRCMGCSQMSTLEEAMRTGWKMCQHCNFTICNFCYLNLEEQRCLSYLCSPKNRKIDAIALPADKIIIFAQENYHADYRQGLLYNLFYKESEKLHAPSFFVVKEKEILDVSDDEKPSKVQEEVWKNFQLVITKRRGGKFITWERVV